MARITVEDCLLHVKNRFVLVMLAAKRARQLMRGSVDPTVPWENDKATVVALREIAAGHTDFSDAHDIDQVDKINQTNKFDRIDTVSDVFINASNDIDEIDETDEINEIDETDDTNNKEKTNKQPIDIDLEDSE